jgi:hypothetical protein
VQPDWCWRWGCELLTPSHLRFTCVGSDDVASPLLLLHFFPSLYYSSPLVDLVGTPHIVSYLYRAEVYLSFAMLSSIVKRGLVHITQTPPGNDTNPSMKEWVAKAVLIGTVVVFIISSSLVSSWS